MLDEDKAFSGSFVLDLRIWWRQAHTLYIVASRIQKNSYFTNKISCLKITAWKIKNPRSQDPRCNNKIFIQGLEEKYDGRWRSFNP